jgi:hypothetical protein
VLEGGYNSLVTSECCESVLRVLMGEDLPLPTPQLLSRSCEPTLRAVIGVQRAHFACLRYDKKTLDRFFADAAQKGQPERVSKRARVAPTLPGEEDEKRSVASSSAPSAKQEQRRQKREEKATELAAKRATAAECAAALATAQDHAQDTRRRVAQAEERLERERRSLREAERTLEDARVAAAAAEQAVDEGDAGDGDDGDDESSSDEDDTNGTSNPRGTCLWSHKVKCEAGRRCFAQYGSDADELWFRCTIVGVHRNDVGQWVDVEYDDGDTEEMKPIKRVRPIDSSSDDESSSSEGEM